ncbi:putative transporter C757.13-like protein 5 [Colletotrichum chlorophyti]|uniref:Putative transporter C757.13-like protein 5 n=1 Tax=Colletotrichum chlorophyti TaxID=708187 RepID=A0A1Q8RSS2_9PEZI|nr:putative transporter C757.13-like protein 5 [Colletotrichum chlorophyti]
MAGNIPNHVQAIAETEQHTVHDLKENASVELAIDSDEEKAVVKKIDRVILPIMAIVYFFQYLDKQSINYAAVFGLSEDLKLTGSEFSWCVSLFYFGQLCSEYPAAYLMSRLPIIRFVGVTMTWVSMFGVSQIVGALLMYGIGSGVHTIATWRVLFMVCGGCTIAAGILFIFAMPGDTKNAWFLNERERYVATQRLALDRATRDRAHFDMTQAKEALKDPRTALYALMALFITLPTPIVKFSSLVINGSGYSKFETMLVGLPSGAIAFILVWIGGLGPRFFPNTRCFFGIFLAGVPLLGSLLLLVLPANLKWGIVASTWLAGSTAPPLGQVVGLMASNVKGNTKKSVVSAVFFIFYCVGCIVGPQLWQQQDAPRYTKGCITSVVSFCCLIVALLVHYFTSKFSNKKRDEIVAQFGDNDDAGLDPDSDLTERQDKGFRYTH